MRWRIGQAEKEVEGNENKRRIARCSGEIQNGWVIRVLGPGGVKGHWSSLQQGVGRESRYESFLLKGPPRRRRKKKKKKRWSRMHSRVSRRAVLLARNLLMIALSSHTNRERALWAMMNQLSYQRRFFWLIVRTNCSAEWYRNSMIESPTPPSG